MIEKKFNVSIDMVFGKSDTIEKVKNKSNKKVKNKKRIKKENEK